jgi:hypothetical protein
MTSGMVKTLKINNGQSASKFESINWLQIRKTVPKLGKLGPLSNSDKDRIEKYTTFEKGGCWHWIGTKQYSEEKGRQHGSFWYNGKYVLIHRIMYHNFSENVPIFERKPGILQVNHKCESNGDCINPKHLYLGTPKQNTRDCIKAGNKVKAKSGQKNHNATLSDDIVEEIKNLKGNTDKTQKELALQYGVNQSQISRWWNNVTR